MIVALCSNLPFELPVRIDSDVPGHVERVSAAVDQNATFAGRASTGRFCQDLPFVRREPALQLRARSRTSKKRLELPESGRRSAC
ncbi:hypothetical protein ABIC65_002435 [Sphingomonas trueperi]|uniref:hypothetical protein n=1 Tax=Sphingomonas trueperi TaxID=53317 RepID=UPI0033994D71